MKDNAKLRETILRLLILFVGLVIAHLGVTLFLLADLGAEMYSMGNLYGGPGDTLIIGKTTGIDSYDLATNTRTELLNWLNSDVNANYVQTVVPLSDGRFLISERNWRSDDSMKLAYMNPVGDSVEKYYGVPEIKQFLAGVATR